MPAPFFQSTLGRMVLWGGGGLVGLLVVLYLITDVFQAFNIALPPAVPVKVEPLEQGWKSGWEIGESQWFHHANQGTRVIRYDWFLALRQPEVSLASTPGKFSDPEYLQRFGFIPSHKFPEQNPDGLPVGFAVNQKFQEPQTGAPPPYAVIGLTCAACHTGQINYQGKGIRIDGGSGMVDLGKFKSALGRAMFYTKYVPGRFNQFAMDVLKDKDTAEAREKLLQEVDAFVAKGKADLDYAKTNGITTRETGFARTDALGLILNRVFDQVNKENLSTTDAPVNFPHIWDAPWFEWVQYNASIRTPMTRNIGEVLGVGGMVSLPGMNDDESDDWNSTVDIENLHQMEKQLAGKAPFQGLQSPKWPEELLGKLDQARITKGAALYKELKCGSCHWSVKDLQAAHEGDGGDASLGQLWTEPNQFGKRFINTARTVKNVELIGTDPGAALNFARRVVIVSNGQELGVAGSKLDFLTQSIRRREYQRIGLLDQAGNTVAARKDEKIDYDGYRIPWQEYAYEKSADGQFNDRDFDAIRAEIENQQDSMIRLGYKARPLNGIWATAPYLHNASVRTLYQLLLPAEQREKSFNLGSKEFDPVHVGYVDEKLTGGFVMDTSLSGNHNTGHEFRKSDVPVGKWSRGVLGRELTHEERLDLIEYLKTL